MSHRARRTLMLPALLFAAALLGACQSAEESTDTLDVNDFCDATVTPNPVTAIANPDGNTYRVPRTNEPDAVFVYANKVTYSLTVSLNSKAGDTDVSLKFPVTLTSTAVQVQPASNGIIITSTGTDTEHYESRMTGATASKITAINGGISMNFIVWYTLPTGGKESVVTTTLNFKDDKGVTFTKTATVNVNP